MNLPFLKKKAIEEENPTQESVSNPAETLSKGMIDIKDIIAPAALEVDFNHIRIGNSYYRTC